MASVAPAFAGAGYDIARGLVSPAIARLCTSYAMANYQLTDYYVAEPQFNAWGRYADSIGEVLLGQLHPAVERITALELWPTYSYLRIYCKGSTLPRHVDRPSCEISVTLTLGGDAPSVWPIWLEADGRAGAVTLTPGDAMVYRGAVIPHWRERFDGRFWVQVFLHYVRRDGEFADCRFDGRERLGPVTPGNDERRADLRRRFVPDDPCPCGSGQLYRDCHGRQGGRPGSD